MTLLHGWGRYPHCESRVRMPASHAELRAALAGANGQAVIARGLGRSYGDSSLAPTVFSSLSRAMLLEFDTERGLLRCEAGASLADILAVIVPRGWFLPVTPGTRFVTAGGAVASDVHGKNHHVDGCFSAHVAEIELMLADGTVVHCAADRNPELFQATCGGMGLTGIILTVQLRLRRIDSALIAQRTFRAHSLEQAFELFEQEAAATYSVAWIDCVASGRQLGRSLLMTGEHAGPGTLAPATARPIAVPADLPARLLNRRTVGAFNSLYFHLPRASDALVHYEKFFYPLDRLLQWNRLYGRKGFLQYQFVLPLEAGAAGMQKILSRISASGRGSFLAVLKRLGGQNANYLSFPVAGYTLALDFKMEEGVLELLNELDAMVTDQGGRLYLAKDSRMSAETFRRGYPAWEKLQAVRALHGASGRFASLQSERIGL
jgi:FAD/FMN-containing dehydrogenase